MLGRALPALCCLWAFAGGCAGPPAPAAGDQFDGTYRGESHVVRGDGGFVCAPRDALASVTIRNGQFDYVYTNYELAAPAPIPVQIAADGSFSGQIQYAADAYMRWGGTIITTWAMVRGRIAGKTLDATVSDYRCARQLQLQIG